MACMHPMKAFKTGYLTENGKPDYLIFSSEVGDIVDAELANKKKRVCFPYTRIINGHRYLTDPIPIPCGHCVGCRMDQAKEWKVRCVLESIYWKHCYFITLTYDDRHLPTLHGEPVLCYEDFQKFMKLLRRYHGDYKFFMCGEYGELGHRPHYHALLFCNDFPGPFRLKRPNAFQSDVLDRCWKHGISEISIADSGMISYVCGYVEKKQKDPLFESYAVKPFRKMSRKPGLGYRYMLDHDISDGFVYGNFGKVKHSPLPRFFQKKSEDQPWYADYKARLVELGRLSLATNQVVYGLKGSALGDAMEIATNKHLEDLRRTKL